MCTSYNTLHQSCSCDSEGQLLLVPSLSVGLPLKQLADQPLRVQRSYLLAILTPSV